MMRTRDLGQGSIFVLVYMCGFGHLRSGLWAWFIWKPIPRSGFEGRQDHQENEESLQGWAVEKVKDQ
jgi:hypothetical protein